MFQKAKLALVAGLAMVAGAAQAAVDTTSLASGMTEAVADAGTIAGVVLVGVVGIGVAFIGVKLIKKGIGKVS